MEAGSPSPAGPQFQPVFSHSLSCVFCFSKCQAHSRFKSLLEAFLLLTVHLLHLLVFAQHHSDCPWHPRTQHLPASPLCMLMSPFSIRAHVMGYIICLFVHLFFAPSETCFVRLGNLVYALAPSTSIMGDCHHDYQKPLLFPN